MYYSELRNTLINRNLSATDRQGGTSKKAAHKEPEGHQGVISNFESPNFRKVNSPF